MKILDKNYKFILSILGVLAFSIILIVFTYFNTGITPKPETLRINSQMWQVRSIDTMKYSRDLARIEINDAVFDNEIDNQISKIAATGANYVAIGTPYDAEFLPFLKRWVTSSRKYNLHVWFRGNFSGWEGWYNYPRIDIQTHTAKTTQFILRNSDLFQDGDIFTSCTECENGIKIDFQDPKSVAMYRSFLISEYNNSKTAFNKIGKGVLTGYFSMNGDVAQAVMDKPTTKALGGIVVIDHYVQTPEKLAEDISELVNLTGGKILLGEFGAPIPNIHGKMTEDEQNDWITKALSQISSIPQLIGVNYWVNKNGTTALWNDDGTEKKAVGTIRNYYLFLKGS